MVQAITGPVLISLSIPDRNVARVRRTPKLRKGCSEISAPIMVTSADAQSAPLQPCRLEWALPA
jgi:hypothetical protein